MDRVRQPDGACFVATNDSTPAASVANSGASKRALTSRPAKCSIEGYVMFMRPSPPAEQVTDSTTMLTAFTRLFRWISKGILALASVSMCAASVALVIASIMKVATAFTAMPAIQSDLLESVSLVVISVAIIDVAKYILEEEVLQDRELREPGEARETITKFIVVISLVVAIESIVFIFNLGHSDPQGLIFPALLLLIFVGMVIGLGLYQKLSIQGEQQLQDMRRPHSVSPAGSRETAPDHCCDVGESSCSA